MNKHLHHQLEQIKVWQKDLAFFRQENALLKYRLSGMVDENEGSSFLQMAEYFQNKFLLSDRKIEGLFESIRIFLEQFADLKPEEPLNKRVVDRQNKLEQAILQFEDDFLNLVNEFNEKRVTHRKH